jgi:hypothetical protein
MNVIARFGRLPLRLQILTLGAMALIAAGIAVGRHPVPPPRTARVTAPDAEVVGPSPAGAQAPTATNSTTSTFANRLPAEAMTDREAEREAPPIAPGYRRDVVRPRPVDNSASRSAEAADPATPVGPPSASGGPANRRRDPRATRPEIFRMPGSPPASIPEAPARPEAEPGAARPAGGSAAGPTPLPAGHGPPLAARETAAPELGTSFAPFGRMIKCQLVNTLDSVTARTEPIVGLVTEDLTWNGQVIIPVDTEVFSYASPQGVVDARGTGRLLDSGEWTLVLPAPVREANGRELILKGRALDRRELQVTDRARVRSWGLDDGADGLVGYTLSTLDDEEIRLFVSAAISGLAQGAAAIAGRQQPSPGLGGLLGATQLAPTAADVSVSAASQGAVAVAGQLATRIRQEIAQRGYYVRVPAGKEFYLFVEQTIDPRAAAIGVRRPASAGTSASPPSAVAGRSLSSLRP